MEAQKNTDLACINIQEEKEIIFEHLILLRTRGV
ncbi:hypothetical protein NSMM_710003 [Nitrosomonas mobilis]|uniref:Uncharacterized protein n=1 Tax=Nitrosomonas mobilis TaxID=51642 RepID=A0A1G5SK42_9PROT|nr:hypothetical protein NSMM_710003 [Nitrosomonas mobilis]